MVFCVNCAHLAAMTVSGHYCGHPVNQSPVTGEVDPVLCETMRDTTGKCGVNGSLYVGVTPAIPPLPEATAPMLE